MRADMKTENRRGAAGRRAGRLALAGLALLVVAAVAAPVAVWATAHRPAPRNLDVTQTDDKEITLTWAPVTDGEPVSYYQVAYLHHADWEDGHDCVTEIDTIVSATLDQDSLLFWRRNTQAEEYTLELNIGYGWYVCVAVRAVNEDADFKRGAYSTYLHKNSWIPSAPRNVNAETSGDMQVRLRWDAPVTYRGAPITRYEYQIDSVGQWFDAELRTEEVVPGLPNGRRYLFTVAAVNEVGRGDTASFSVLVVWTPSAPRNLAAEPGNGQVTLTCDPPSSDGGATITSYEYRHRSQLDDRSWPPWMDDWRDWAGCGAASSEAAVAGLDNGTKYQFQVRAVNQEGPGVLESVEATPSAKPDAPGGLMAEPGDGQVILTWGLPSNVAVAPVTGYQYQYLIGSSTNWKEADWSDIGAATFRVTVEGLTNDQEYSFGVRAVYAQGEGDVATRTATPSAPLSKPRDLSAEPGNGQVTLTWMAPLDGASSIQKYQYRYRSSGSWTNWADAGSGLSEVVASLTNGQEYTFEVRAVNTLGGSGPATVTATPSESPSAPRNPGATPGDGQVTLTWGPPSNAAAALVTGYQYRYRIGDSGNWPDEEGWTDTGATLQQVTVAGLINDLLYSFEVRAVSVAGVGPAAVTVTATPSRPLSEPRSLNAKAGDREVLLTWVVPLDGESSVTGYEYRVDGESWRNVPVELSGTCESMDTCVQVMTLRNGRRLMNGQRYVFDVRAVNTPEGESTPEESGPAATVTATPFGSPSAPGDLGATPDNRQVTLKWTAPNNNGSPVTHYEYVSYECGSGGCPAVEIVDSSDNRCLVGEGWTGPVNTREVTVSDLENGEEHFFCVRAVNRRDVSRAATVTETPSVTPSAPVELSATPDNERVTLTWKAPKSDGGSPITHYEYQIDGRGWLDADMAPTTTCPDTDSAPDNGAETSYEQAICGLNNGQEYSFEVRAVNAQGEGMAAMATATPSRLPTEPHLTATPGDGEVTLIWTQPASDGGSEITGYQYRCRVDDGGDSGSCGEDWTDAGLALTETVTRLTNGQEYRFEVRAVNARGAGPVATATATPSRKPSQPGNLSAAPGNGQVMLTWAAPSSNGGSPITHYEYRVDGSGSWIGTETVLSATVMDLENGRSYDFTVMDLENGRSYDFEVRAVNAQGTGEAATATAMLAPVPPAPRNLSAAPGDGRVTLTWAATVERWRVRHHALRVPDRRRETGSVRRIRWIWRQRLCA